MKEMNRKEFLKLAVKGTAAAAVLSALPSTLTAYADEGEKLYIPGTYSAEAPGKEKVIVTMTFDETKITDVQVDVSAETPEIGGIHGETLRAQLLEKQSADIDGVTGATMTSNGVKEAAANCIRQALGLEIEEKEDAAVTGDSIDALLAEYRTELESAPASAEDKETKTKDYWQSQIDWLTERFPDGVYRDVIGLCKAAKLDGEDGIIDQDYSLNAGRYVGVVIEDDGMTEAQFKETMLGLNAGFESLNDEAKKLEAEIAENLKRLFMK